MASSQQYPDDYCALLCREPNKLYLINSQPMVVTVIERCLARFSLEYRLYSKSSATTAFKLNSCPFSKGGCSEGKTIRVKERSFIINIYGAILNHVPSFPCIIKSENVLTFFYLSGSSHVNVSVLI